MTIRDQLECLVRFGVELVVVGGQAGVMRQAVEFSKDLDVLVRPTPENARRVQGAVHAITEQHVDIETVLGRDFQQYVHPGSGDEIDVHLRLLSIPTYEAGLANADVVDYLGVRVQCLELPALYASKRTDRPRDAVHRQAIEDRLRALVLAGAVAPDEIVLACCLDAAVAARMRVDVEALASTTAQPMLQVRALALGAAPSSLLLNETLHPTARAIASLAEEPRSKLLGHGARLAAALAKVPLLLPASGYRVRSLRP